MVTENPDFTPSAPVDVRLPSVRAKLEPIEPVVLDADFGESMSASQQVYWKLLISIQL